MMATGSATSLVAETAAVLAEECDRLCATLNPAG